MAVDPDDLAVMRRIDELYLASPFYGSAEWLRCYGAKVWYQPKRVQRLMRLMGLEAIYQKPNTSQGHPDNKVYPYLLRGLIVARPNQVWCADITYIPMAKGLLPGGGNGLVQPAGSVVALSISIEADFCVRRFRKRWSHMGGRDLDTDQGVQFTSAGFVDELETADVRINMDGEGGFSTTSSLSGCGAA